MANNFNKARGGPLEDMPDTGIPPFDFQGVTTRIFPVKANISRLTLFCDNYLNMDIPRDIIHFRPAFPYVLVMIINYGRMSMAARNLGWVSQNEVVFNIPLEVYRKVDGRLVFQDWASVSPYIYVDDDMSILTGRDVYGWPKVKGWIGSETSPWAGHPKDQLRVFSLKINMLPKLYAGERQVPKTLLDIICEPTPDFSEVPPNFENPYNPLLSIPRAVLHYTSLINEALETFSNLPVRGYASRDMDTVFDMYDAGLKRMRAFIPGTLFSMLAGDRESNRSSGTLQESGNLFFQNVTLKQFRDAQNPDSACYQAIATSSIGVNRFNRGGLLGDPQQLRGDPSGGFRVWVHRYPGQPVVESLGLLVDEEKTIEGHTVDILKPVFPSWTDFDLRYGKGDVICHRTYRGLSDTASGWVAGQHAEPRSISRHAQKAPYNTTRGAAVQEIAGPFRFPDMTCQVYPLLADIKQLESFCNRYLNDELSSTQPRLSFEPFGAYVYMVVTSMGSEVGTMWSESNNIGWWADREIAFYVPVKCYEESALSSLSLLCPYVFANSGRAVATDREINGRPTVLASIESPPDAWLGESGPVKPRSLLTMKTEILPALFLGQQAKERVLLEIGEAGPLRYNDDVGWRHIAESWGEELITDLKRKANVRQQYKEQLENGQALALELLGNGESWNAINLKQFRDAADPKQFCYQAVVQIKRRIERIYDLQEIEQPIHIRLHKFPTQPIVQTLGLKVKKIDSETGEDIVQWLEPIRPFWMRFAMEEDIGNILCWRSHNGEWNVPDKSDKPDDSTSRRYFQQERLSRVGHDAVTAGEATRWPPRAFRGCKETSHAWLQTELARELVLLKHLSNATGSEEQQKLCAPLSKNEILHLNPRVTAIEPDDSQEREWQRFLHSWRKVWPPELSHIKLKLDKSISGELKSVEEPYDEWHSWAWFLTCCQGDRWREVAQEEWEKLQESAPAADEVTNFDRILAEKWKNFIEKEWERFRQSMLSVIGRADIRSMLPSILASTLPRGMQEPFAVMVKQYGDRDFDDSLKITFKAGLETYWNGLWKHYLSFIDEDGLKEFLVSSQKEWDDNFEMLAAILADIAGAGEGTGQDQFMKLLDSEHWGEYVKEQMQSSFLQILEGTQLKAWKAMQDSFDVESLTDYVEILLRRSPVEMQRDFQSRRLSRAEAIEFVHNTNEPQLVIESILSKEWEHWGNPRSNRNLPPIPELCVRSDSVGGAFLKDIYGDFMRRHGLEEDVDGSWWSWRPPGDDEGRS